MLAEANIGGNKRQHQYHTCCVASPVLCLCVAKGEWGNEKRHLLKSDNATLGILPKELMKLECIAKQ